MQNVTSAVQTASSSVVSAMSPATASAVALGQKLMATGLTAQQAGQQMIQMGIATNTVAQALAVLTAQAQPAAAAVANVANSAAAATTRISGMDRAMAMATGRMAGMAAGAGMLGGALGRVAAMSATLGPILASAFPVFAVIALVDVVVMAHQKILDVTSAMAGWDKEAKSMFDMLEKLNQETLRFNGNLLVEKLRLNEIGLSGSALDLQKEANAKTELQIKTAELTESLQHENNIRQQLQGTERTIKSINPRAPVSVKVTDLPDKDATERLNKELREAIENSRRLTEEIEKLKSISIPAAAEQARVAKMEETARAMEASRRSSEAYEKATEHLRLKTESLTDAQKKLNDEIEEFGRKQEAATVVSGAKDLEERQAAERQFRQERITDAKNASIAAIALQQTEVQERARLGQITASQELQQLNALAAQKLAIETQYLDARINTILGRLASDDAKAYTEDLREWSKLLSEKLKAQQQFQKEVQKITDTSERASVATIKGYWQGMTASINSNLVAMVNGHETIGRGIQKIWTGIVDDIIVDFAKMGEKWVLQHVIMAAASKLFHLQDAAASAASVAAKIASVKAAGLAQVGLAGAGGVASMAAAPFPIDLTAPEFGASMAAAAASLLAFEHGGFVPGSGPVPIIAHGGEQVLTPAQQRERNGNTTNFTVNYNPTIHGSPVASAKDMLDAHGKRLTKGLMRELRRRNL